MSADSSSIFDASERLYSLYGTKQARFTNRYSPVEDKPSTQLHLNTDVYLDEELLDLLKEDRRRYVKNHVVVDKVFKAYMLDLKGFATIMRT